MRKGLQRYLRFLNDPEGLGQSLGPGDRMLVVGMRMLAARHREAIRVRPALLRIQRGKLRRSEYRSILRTFDEGNPVGDPDHQLEQAHAEGPGVWASREEMNAIRALMVSKIWTETGYRWWRTEGTSVDPSRTVDDAQHIASPSTSGKGYLDAWEEVAPEMTAGEIQDAVQHAETFLGSVLPSRDEITMAPLAVCDLCKRVYLRARQRGSTRLLRPAQRDCPRCIRRWPSSQQRWRIRHRKGKV